jgi:hypothetical protein
MPLTLEPFSEPAIDEMKVVQAKRNFPQALLALHDLIVSLTSPSRTALADEHYFLRSKYDVSRYQIL